MTIELEITDAMRKSMKNQVYVELSQARGRMKKYPCNAYAALLIEAMLDRQLVLELDPAVCHELSGLREYLLKDLRSPLAK